MTKMLKLAEAASLSSVRTMQKETVLMDFHTLQTIEKAANCAIKIKCQDSGVHPILNHMVSISNLTMVYKSNAFVNLYYCNGAILICCLTWANIFFS